jgi:hypothetical protein
VRTGRAIALAGLVALLATGCGSKRSAGHTTTAATPTIATVPWPETTPRVEFGTIRSFTPLGAGYELRLDLQLLFGPDKTGLAACIDNHECRKGTTGFDDDSYGHDLHYVVTYYAPPATPVELVSFTAKTPPIVTARYFYGLAHGRNPRHIQVMARGADALREFGFYVEVSPRFSAKRYQSVLRMYQQYHP